MTKRRPSTNSNGLPARCLRGNHDDRGDTLIEVLITLIVMSITAVSVLFAFSGSIAGSSTHRNLVTNDVALRTVAQSVYADVQQQATPLYNPCATYYGSSGPSAQFNAPPNFLVAVSVTGYYYESSNTYGWQASLPPKCQPVTPPVPPVPQQLLITLTPPQGSKLFTTIVVNGSSASASTLSITSITPSSAPPNTNGQYIVIEGTGFQSGAVGSFPAGSGITFTGAGSTSPSSSPQPSSWTFDSSTTITAEIDVASGTPTGPVTFTLTNPDHTTATKSFTIAAGPRITEVNGSANPPQLFVGTTNVPFNLSGTDFQSGASVSFTNSSGVSFDASNPSPGWVVTSSTSIETSVDVSSDAPTGTFYVTVTNPDGQVSNPFPFTVSYPAPTITTVNSGDSGTICYVKFKGNSGNSAPRLSAHDDKNNTNCTVIGTNFYQPVTYKVTPLSGNNCVPSSALTRVSRTTLTIQFTNTCGSSWTKDASTYSLTVTTPGGSTTYSPAFSITGSGG